MAKRKKPAAEPALDAETLELMRRYEAMPDAWKIADQRGRALATLLRWREMMKKAPHKMPGDPQRIYDVPFYRERIRENQIRLLRLRAWRAIGIKPGSG